MRQKRYRPIGSQREQISRHFTTGRKRSYPLRYYVLDAILRVVETGTQWRMLPGEFAQWQTVYYYFRRWRQEAHILCILSITSRAVRRRSSHHGGPSALIIACQSLSPASRFQAPEWAESAALTPSGEAHGRKRHIVVDTQGLLSGLVVHAAGDHETQWALQLLAPIVRRIFPMRRRREMSLRAIAEELNAEGVPTQRGGDWHASTVRYILQNPKYDGRMQHTFEADTV